MWKNLNIDEVLNGPFNLEVHKATFTNYLEAVISPDGIVEYAMPSHLEKLISIYCKEYQVSRDELYDAIPITESPGLWLCEHTGYIAVWDNFYIGEANNIQKFVLKQLKDEGVYTGGI